MPKGGQQNKNKCSEEVGSRTPNPTRRNRPGMIFVFRYIMKNDRFGHPFGSCKRLKATEKQSRILYLKVEKNDGQEMHNVVISFYLFQNMRFWWSRNSLIIELILNLNQTSIYQKGIQKTMQTITVFFNKSKKSRQIGPWSAPSARSAIWRRGVPTNEKKFRPLRRDRVTTHASRPEYLANSTCYFINNSTFHHTYHWWWVVVVGGRWW